VATSTLWLNSSPVRKLVHDVVERAADPPDERGIRILAINHGREIERAQIADRVISALRAGPPRRGTSIVSIVVDETHAATFDTSGWDSKMHDNARLALSLLGATLGPIQPVVGALFSGAALLAEGAGGAAWATRPESDVITKLERLAERGCRHLVIRITAPKVRTIHFDALTATVFALRLAHHYALTIPALTIIAAVDGLPSDPEDRDWVMFGVPKWDAIDVQLVCQTSPSVAEAVVSLSDGWMSVASELCYTLPISLRSRELVDLSTITKELVRAFYIELSNALSRAFPGKPKLWAAAVEVIELMALLGGRVPAGLLDSVAGEGTSTFAEDVARSFEDWVVLHHESPRKTFHVSDLVRWVHAVRWTTLKAGVDEVPDDLRRLWSYLEEGVKDTAKFGEDLAAEDALRAVAFNCEILSIPELNASYTEAANAISVKRRTSAARRVIELLTLSGGAPAETLMPLCRQAVLDFQEGLSDADGLELVVDSLWRVRDSRSVLQLLRIALEAKYFTLGVGDARLVEVILSVDGVGCAGAFFALYLSSQHGGGHRVDRIRAAVTFLAYLMHHRPTEGIHCATLIVRPLADDIHHEPDTFDHETDCGRLLGMMVSLACLDEGTEDGQAMLSYLTKDASRLGAGSSVFRWASRLTYYSLPLLSPRSYAALALLARTDFYDAVRVALVPAVILGASRYAPLEEAHWWLYFAEREKSSHLQAMGIALSIHVPASHPNEAIAQWADGMTIPTAMPEVRIRGNSVPVTSNLGDLFLRISGLHTKEEVIDWFGWGRFSCDEDEFLEQFSNGIRDGHCSIHAQDVVELQLTLTLDRLCERLGVDPHDRSVWIDALRRLPVPG